MRTLRVGARGSPLSLAQTRGVLAQLEALEPGLHFELHRIDTPGDRDRASPLSRVSHPSFFSADIDDALLAGRVDIAIHSYKDLPAMRPEGLVTAALSTREDPRDVVVFRGDARGKLLRGETLRLGTSTPRRHANCARFLTERLPHGGSRPSLEFADIRGNVDQRLAALGLLDGQVQRYDGVILALAGLNRLCRDETAARLVTPMLARARFAVLPLSECPAASGQGVLALECRSDDALTRELLARLHDPRSARELEAEGAALAEVPEALRTGCGATATEHPALGRLVWVRGEHYERTWWSQRPAPPEDTPAAGTVTRRRFEGSLLNADAASAASISRSLPADAAALFVTHSRALGAAGLPDHVRLWAGGATTWKALAKKGHWVEGCSEPLGFEALAPTLASPALALPPLEAWTVLTSASAREGWSSGRPRRVLGTFDHADARGVPEVLREQARNARHFYWTSSREYQLLRDALPPDAEHACGPGRTLERLRHAGLAHVRPFPSVREWRAWLD